MDGSDKRELFIIGKSQNPRCFKNVKRLPVSYKANKNAWMTSALFEEWVGKLNQDMKRQNRNIALIVDNAPSHPLYIFFQVIMYLYKY